ncbi:MAG: histidine triad nucleotide-binding protein [Chloroflexi bacterium RBG_16_63_12]|nr:MAG: histidine triad nucleotide-binding protein [Chloroflexi bacterium RBG_16_63_12]
MSAGPENCLFCRIGRGEIPSKRVHEDDRCFAFEDISPQAPTHLLVCPREHVASLAETDAVHEADLGHLFVVAAKLARERGLDAYRAVVNTGAGAGQSVFHVHVHLLGGRGMRWPPG